MKCNNCGAENDEGFRFCGTCGRPLAPSVVIPPETSTIRTIPADSPTLPAWKLPHLDAILDGVSPPPITLREVSIQVRLIESTLEQLGAPTKVTEVNQGPRITQFGVEPIGKSGIKTRVNQITALKQDLELALAVAPIRFEMPIPGRSIIGIDVPNRSIAPVRLSDVLGSTLRSPVFSELQVALGQDMVGRSVTPNLRTMPHLLIAGTTGMGKSVCITSILASLLLYHTPDSLRLVMADPKRVELIAFHSVPHNLGSLIVTLDELDSSLRLTAQEMRRRFGLFAESRVRDICSYNAKIRDSGTPILPYIVILIDELAGFDGIPDTGIEKNLAQLLQEGHTAGIHLVLSTQKPSTKVISGLVRSKFLSRISFTVRSAADSRIVLEAPGAETLEGPGDMLYRTSDSANLMRIQGCFVSDRELNNLVTYWQSIPSRTRPSSIGSSSPTFAQSTQPPLSDDQSIPPKPAQATGAAPDDELLSIAIEVAKQNGRVSVSLLQRKLRLGYSRAARLIELLEEKGVVGPDEGPTKGRSVRESGSPSIPKPTSSNSSLDSRGEDDSSDPIGED